MKLRNKTIDISVRYVPKNELAKGGDIKPKTKNTSFARNQNKSCHKKNPLLVDLDYLNE